MNLRRSLGEETGHSYKNLFHYIPKYVCVGLFSLHLFSSSNVEYVCSLTQIAGSL